MEYNFSPKLLMMVYHNFQLFYVYLVQAPLTNLCFHLPYFLLDEIVTDWENNELEVSKAQIEFARAFYLKGKALSDILGTKSENDGEELFPDIKKHLKTPESKMELARKMREGIIQKLLSDSRVQDKLAECGICIPDKRVSLLPCGAEKTAKEENLKKDGVQIHSYDMAEESIQIGISEPQKEKKNEKGKIEKTPYGKAEEAAKRYYEMILKLENIEISE